VPIVIALVTVLVALAGCAPKASTSAAGPTTTTEALPSPYDIGCQDFLAAAEQTRRGAVPSMSATIDVPPSAELPDLVEQGCTAQPERSVGVVIHDQACGVVTPAPEPASTVPPAGVAPETVTPTTAAPTTAAPAAVAPAAVGGGARHWRAGGGSGGGRTSSGRTGNGHSNGGRSSSSSSNSGSSSSNDDDDPTPTTRATHAYQGCGHAR